MSNDENENSIEKVSQIYSNDIIHNDNILGVIYSELFLHTFSEGQSITLNQNIDGSYFDNINGNQNISNIIENNSINTENKNEGKIVEAILISSKEEDKEKNSTKDDEKKYPFKISKKTGRKRKYKETLYEYVYVYDSDRLKHSNLSNDNVAKKIVTHYLRFLILFLNVILGKLNCKQKFFGFNKKLEIFSNASKSNIRKIYENTIRDILHFEITQKHKKTYEEDKYKNKSIYKEVLTNFPQLKYLFEKKIIDIFNEIYYNKIKKNLKIIDLNKYNINLIIDLKKEKLEIFDDLLEKETEVYNKMKEVIESDYFKYDP